MIESLQNILSYPIKNWIIWVGAGISRPNPSSLPLGWELTQFALSQTCDSEVQNKIFDIWDRANKIASTSSNSTPLGLIPRLESILGEIEDVQSKLKTHKFNFMEGFKTFVNTPYNKNHLYIAELLSSGATVITTNFDLCIQKAYRDIVQGTDELVLKIDKNTFCYEPRSNIEAGKLWHVHGTCDDVSSLGATVRMIKEGLSSEFQKYLDNRFDNSCALIFLGYSASDSFDVNLYFSNKKRSQFSNSMAAYIQHGTSSAPPNANYLIQCFRSSTIENGDTSEFLEKLSKTGYGCSRSEEIFDWKQAFLQKAILADKDKIKEFLICKISYMLGINIDNIDSNAYRNALQLENYYDRIDFHKTLALVCRVKGISDDEKRHDLNVKVKDSDLLGFYYAQGDFKNALKYAKSVDELYQDASNLSRGH